MKTKEELNAPKAEVEVLNQKLAKLTEEELTQVTGGDLHPGLYDDDPKDRDYHVDVKLRP